LYALTDVSKTLPTNFPTCNAQGLTERLALRHDKFSYILWAGEVGFIVLITVDTAIVLSERKKYLFPC
jgi:hypothetical protein